MTQKKMSSPSKKICMVCGDKALGYNFNAITCESCKAFFRRNALLNKEFTCPFSKNCEITVVTRRFCQRCRLEKCFQIGMKKEHIMSEEEKIRKRRKIEQNRAKRKKDDKPEGDESSASEREDSCNNNHGKRGYNCRSPYDYNHSSLSCESQAQEHYENGPQSVVPKKESHQFPTINGTPAELVDGIVAIPEMSGQVINYLMKTSKDAMNVMSKIINSPKDAMKLISHLINYPGDALKIISKIMNSPFDALTVFTKFMSSPTDALEIITKIVSSPGDVLQFLQQLMNSPEDAVQIMDTFMNSPAEALRIINRMVNNSTVVDSTTPEAPTEPRCTTEDGGNSNTMINMMLSSAQSPLSSAGLSPEVVQPSTSSIEIKSEYMNAFTGSSHSSQSSLNNPIHNGSTSSNSTVINSHSNSHKNNPMNGIKNEPTNNGGESSINLNSQMKVPRDAMKNILEDVEDRPIHPNSFESVLCEAIKLEYETYNSLPQTCGDSRDLSEAEEVKLNELILASKALYHPVDDDLSSLINDDERIKDDASSQDPQLLKLINLTAVAIRRLIKMSKKINAFRNMCQEDQVALLKGGCTEMMIMRSVMSYDCDHATWKIPHSKEDMSNIRVDVLKLAKGNVYEEHERFIHTFEPKWRMDENIILIMCAIVLFTPSRPRVIHSDVIKLEQNSYYYLLRRYLESVYPGCEAKSTFIKLIQKINEVQRLNEVIIGVYLNVNPSQVEPLLREIFDLKNH